MNIPLPKIIGITELRANTRKIFDMVKKEAIPLLVLRDSKPEAVIISYKDYELLTQETKRLWNVRLDELAKKTKQNIATWLKKKGYNPNKMTGDQLLEILEKDDDKSRR
ncbi:type II toxin-antitoxin system Phd/YefM family antitoxin [Candidatus Roizmanbacteria bacterium]|nr:type II toxin-antitoxin system Phd/YefM family antitoxin [Candidatus Roizmanbacteria bacterium]